MRDPWGQSTKVIAKCTKVQQVTPKCGRDQNPKGLSCALPCFAALYCALVFGGSARHAFFLRAHLRGAIS